MKIDDFIKELGKLNIAITNNQIDMLNKYCNSLIEYNLHTNITAINSKEDIFLKHFYDSLTVCRVLNLNNKLSVIDIGTGAGFPGVVLKIVFPHLRLTLLDSNNKKTKFLDSLIKNLNLQDVIIVNMRAEDYALSHLNEFDVCVSRAVAFLDIIIELSLPFIKQNGKVVLMKGTIDSELKVLERFQKRLNIYDYDVHRFTLPVSGDERTLITVQKSKITNKVKTYPQILKQNKLIAHNLKILS